MRHILIILSLLLLSSFLTSCEKKEGTLYWWGEYHENVWKGFGDKETHPKYEGEITNGEPNGFGFMTYPYDDKNIVGEWKIGKEWNTKHKDKYGNTIGAFVNGQSMGKMGVLFSNWNGTGKWEWFTKPNELTYVKYNGQIRNGIPNGEGVMTGRKIRYVGEWRFGKEHGKGVQTVGDESDSWKSRYEGQFKDGYQHGQGTETFKGRVYTGEWVKGRKHGQGQMIHSHKILYGHKEVGEWKNNKPWNTENFDEEGKIIIKTKNGSKICHKWKLPKCSK